VDDGLAYVTAIITVFLLVEGKAECSVMGTLRDAKKTEDDKEIRDIKGRREMSGTTRVTPNRQKIPFELHELGTASRRDLRIRTH